MAYDDVALKTDLNDKPVPQHYSSSDEDFEANYGKDNAGYSYIYRIAKGNITTVHTAIVETTISSEIDCDGFNAVNIECAVSELGEGGSWTVDVQGCFVTLGNVGDCYFEGDKLSTGVLSSNGVYIFTFRGIPRFIKIKATRTSSGKLTCKVQPCIV